MWSHVFSGRLLLFLAVLLAGCSTPTGPTPPVTGGGNSNAGPGQPQLQAIGCFLQGASAGAANLATLANSGQIYFPSGHVQVDNFLQTEGVNLVNTYFLSPRMFLLVDNQSPNAYATPEVANAFGQDGTILLGHRLMTEQLQRDGSGSTIVAIMAHEFAHLAQFKGGFRESGKRPELHADFMAGWYLSVRGRYAWTNLMPALQIFFALGDYQFNSPGHHGTPQERLAAAQAGFGSGAQSALQAYQQGLQHVSRF